MVRQLLIITIFIFVFLGCRSVPSSNPGITSYFIGFSIADIDTLVLRKYKANDSFHHLIDTLQVTTNIYSGAAYRTSHDTTSVDFNNIGGSEKDIFPGSDWQVYIPALNKTVSVSNLVCPPKESDCFKCGCYNEIASFEQDGQATVPARGIVLAAFSNNIGYGYGLIIRK